MLITTGRNCDRTVAQQLLWFGTQNKLKFLLLNFQ